MIKEIHISNYKSHKGTDLILKPISIFIGPNNSGKSGVLQALQLLKESIKSGAPATLIPPKPVARNVSRQPNQAVQYSYPNLSLDVGNFSDVIGKNGNKITIGFKADVTPLSAAMQRRSIDKIFLEYEITFINNQISSHKGKVIAGEHAISWEFDIGKGGRVNPPNIIIEGINVNFQCVGIVHQPLSRGPMTVPPGTSSDIQTDVADFAQAITESIRNFFNSISFVSGIRGFEEHAYHLADSPTNDMELMLLEDRSVAISSTLPYNRTLENKLSEWLEKFLGIGIEFELVSPGKLVKIRTKTKNNKTGLFIGEGLGIHQLAFIFFPIAQAQLRTICIEEPEVHLHPEAQTQLAAHLLRIYKEEGKQYIIPTHSEHILFGFLSAVAKKEISHDELGIYYFKKNEHNVTEVNTLSIDEQGRIPGGLPGFFDHSVKNLINYIESLEG